MSLIWDEINDAKTLVAYITKGLRMNKPFYAKTIMETHARAEYWRGELKKFLETRYLLKRTRL